MTCWNYSITFIHRFIFLGPAGRSSNSSNSCGPASTRPRTSSFRQPGVGILLASSWSPTWQGLIMVDSPSPGGKIMKNPKQHHMTSEPRSPVQGLLHLHVVLVLQGVEEMKPLPRLAQDRTLQTSIFLWFSHFPMVFPIKRNATHDGVYTRHLVSPSTDEPVIPMDPQGLRLRPQWLGCAAYLRALTKPHGGFMRKFTWKSACSISEA